MKELAHLFFLLSFLLFGCEQPAQEKSVSRNQVSTVKKEVSDSLTSRHNMEYETRFHLITLAEYKSLGDSMSTLQKTLCALNRVDSTHLLRKKTLVAPIHFNPDLNAYAPFPNHLDVLKTTSKMLLVSYRLQAFAFYENGNLRRWGPVSMGKKSSPTPTGLYYCNWKSKSTRSTVDSTWIMNWYINIDNFNGISLHEYSLPGYPASHACIRLLESDARWIFQRIDTWELADNQTIAKRGTPVLLFGQYDFSKVGPWSIPDDQGMLPCHQEEELNHLLRRE